MHEIIVLTAGLLTIIGNLEMTDTERSINVELIVKLQNNLLDKLNIHSPLTVDEQVTINLEVMNALKRQEQAALN
jgi:hypothetical protein